jgi:hypothetical protein
VALTLGALLRLVWVEDMEWKFDEQWTYRATRHFRQTRAMDSLGMYASVGIRNPGMSLWVFVILSEVFRVDEPTGLARAAQLLNIGALLLLCLFVLRSVPEGEREPWLWAVALYAVNPLAVLFHRKIWAQSVLPMFVVVTLIGWWHRRRPWGALVWGLVGALLGQIHMGGFLFAAGLVSWALLFDRKGVEWRSWMIGSVTGTIPLLPWLRYFFKAWAERPAGGGSFGQTLLPRYWYYLVTDPLGLGLDYSLEESFREFLGYPLLGGRPTYLIGLLHLLILAVGVWLAVRAAWPFPQAPSRLAGAVLDRNTPTAFTQNAALWPYGILLTALGLTVYRHYMIIIYPFEILCLCRLALLPRGDVPGARRVGRASLGTLWVAQVLLSVGFLWYIHETQTAHGDYGVPYGAQQRSAASGLSP